MVNGAYMYRCTELSELHVHIFDVKSCGKLLIKDFFLFEGKSCAVTNG